MPAGLRLFAAGLFLILTVPRMTQPGMFSDGVVYASIARNMAESQGSFWTPQYTQIVLPVFVDHPPLAIWLESLFFRMAGDHPYVERAYSLTMGIALALLIVALWRRTSPDPRADALPVVFWLLPSFVTWSIVNNMLDVTQAVFTTMAVLAVVAAMRTAGRAKASAGRWWVWSIVAWLATAAAVMAKGPTGLFPLAAPTLYALTIDRGARARAIGVTGVVLAVLAVAGAVLWSYEPARDYARAYVDVQLLPSLSGEREAAGSRWRFVEVFGIEILARMGGLLVIAWWLVRRRRPGEPDVPSGTWALALFFLCVGLAASLPIAVSPKMMGHYLVPSIPMFALACAFWVWPANRDGSPDGAAEPGANQWRRPTWAVHVPGAAGIALIVTALALPLVRGPLEERDVPRLGAIDLIAPSLRPGEIVRSCPDAEGDWPLHAYLQRFLHVSMDVSPRPRATFLRLRDRPCDVPAGCVLERFAGDLEMYACSAP